MIGKAIARKAKATFLYLYAYLMEAIMQGGYLVNKSGKLINKHMLLLSNNMVFNI